MHAMYRLGVSKDVYTSQYGVETVCALLVYVYVHSRRRTRFSLSCSYLRLYDEQRIKLSNKKL